MKLFKKDGKFKKYVEFSYAVGEPVEVFDSEDGWQVYEVCERENNTIYLEPFGFSLDLNWLYDLDSLKIRQTPNTFKLARKIYEAEIQELQEQIDHQREKEDIKEIKRRLQLLPADQPEGSKHE